MNFKIFFALMDSSNYLLITKMDYLTSLNMYDSEQSSKTTVQNIYKWKHEVEFYKLCSMSFIG